jgi:hypothetical protein
VKEEKKEAIGFLCSRDFRFENAKVRQLEEEDMPKVKRDRKLREVQVCETKKNAASLC